MSRYLLAVSIVALNARAIVYCVRLILMQLIVHHRQLRNILDVELDIDAQTDYIDNLENREDSNPLDEAFLLGMEDGMRFDAFDDAPPPPPPAVSVPASSSSKGLQKPTDSSRSLQSSRRSALADTASTAAADISLVDVSMSANEEAAQRIRERAKRELRLRSHMESLRSEFERLQSIALLPARVLHQRPPAPAVLPPQRSTTTSSQSVAASSSSSRTPLRSSAMSKSSERTPNQTEHFHRDDVNVSRTPNFIPRFDVDDDMDAENDGAHFVAKSISVQSDDRDVYAHEFGDGHYDAEYLNDYEHSDDNYDVVALTRGIDHSRRDIHDDRRDGDDGDDDNDNDKLSSMNTDDDDEVDVV